MRGKVRVGVWNVSENICPLFPGSSDEEEDDMVFSDYRGSDSDSGEGGEVYRDTAQSHKHKRKGGKVKRLC